MVLRRTLSSLAWSCASNNSGSCFWRNVILESLTLEYSCCWLVAWYLGVINYLIALHTPVKVYRYVRGTTVHDYTNYTFLSMVKL